MVVELAVAVVLLAGAGLLGKSLHRLLHVPLGFDPNHLATLQVTASGTVYNDDEQTVGLYREIVRRVSSLPGVDSAGMTSMLPVQCNRAIDGIHFSRKAYHGEHNDVDERHVSGEYLSMLKARLLRGRSFTDADDSSRAGVAVINQALAQKYFPGEDPVGKRIANDEGGQFSLWEIVGVVDDVREGPLDARTMAPFQFLLSQRGGKVPSARWRSLLTLTLAEREDISRGIASASSIREIAKGLQRAASRVSREVARHGGRPLYRANEADHQAWESALRPKACLLATHVKLRTIDGRSERTILRTA